MRFGIPNLKNASMVVEVLTKAVEFAVSGQAIALCTLPIHKQALQDGAGFEHPGHTEFLAALCGAKLSHTYNTAA